MEEVDAPAAPALRQFDGGSRPGNAEERAFSSPAEPGPQSEPDLHPGDKRVDSFLPPPGLAATASASVDLPQRKARPWPALSILKWVRRMHARDNGLRARGPAGPCVASELATISLAAGVVLNGT